MTPRPEQKVARGEWWHLTLRDGTRSPAAALAAVRAVYPDPTDADVAYFLFDAAAEDLLRLIETQERHPDSRRVWNKAEAMCRLLPLGRLAIGRPLLAEIRADADAIPTNPDGTCIRFERAAILLWCHYADRAFAILEQVEAAERNTP